MHHLYVAPTFISLASMVAARRAGQYRPRGTSTLLLTNNAAIPEVQPGIEALPGFDALAEEFDEIVSLNELIHPHHPRAYTARRFARDELRSAIIAACGGREPATITAQSLHVRPTENIVDLFPEARIHVVSDGLMSYGPTRFDIPLHRSDRVDRLLHLDLVHGLVPVLLSEYDVPTEIIPTDSFREVIRDFAERSQRPVLAVEDRPDALLLGQYLAALGLLTEQEEESLHLDMLRAAVADGARRIVFKPHPSAPPTFTDQLTALARDLGVELTTMTDSTPVEVLYEQWRPRTAVGCFSTGLATASSIFDIDVFSTGAVAVARGLPRFEDSNRVPLALVHAGHRRAVVDDQGEVAFSEKDDIDLQLLVNELAFAMQPRDYPLRRDDRRSEIIAAHPDLATFFAPPATVPVPVAPNEGHTSPRDVRSLVRLAAHRVERMSPGPVRQLLASVRSRLLPMR